MCPSGADSVGCIGNGGDLRLGDRRRSPLRPSSTHRLRGCRRADSCSPARWAKRCNERRRGVTRELRVGADGPRRQGRTLAPWLPFAQPLRLRLRLSRPGKTEDAPAMPVGGEPALGGIRGVFLGRCPSGNRTMNDNPAGPKETRPPHTKADGLVRCRQKGQSSFFV